MKRVLIGLLVNLLIVQTTVSTLSAKAITPKTPTDVYNLALELKEKVQRLRNSHNVETPWPEKPRQIGKAPRHVLQKGLDVLTKINRLRIIKKMGRITIPTYPSREITPDEVYDLVKRLVAEMVVIIPHTENTLVKEQGKTPNDVFRLLSEISNAFDPLLGVIGTIPGEVYAESERVVKLVTFLRRSQNLYMDIKIPQKPGGKHPNHALAASYRLLEKIAGAEKNLWIDPVTVPKIPHRVIKPVDVFESLEVIVAELQRIKFRLGIERSFKSPDVDLSRTPNDVIRNLDYATALMPLFSKNQQLIQYNPDSLRKTPDHVFAVTKHILDNLKRFRKYRGIMVRPKQPVAVLNLSSRHVYQKTLECIEKTNHMRIHIGMGEIAASGYPARSITPTEVYELMVRLDSELALIYQESGMKNDTSWIEADRTESFEEKSPSDVYHNVWQISYMLDTLLGSEGFEAIDVYRQAVRINAELSLIEKHLPEEIKTPPMPELRQGLSPTDLFHKTHEVIDLIHAVQVRAGLFGTIIPKTTIIGNITLSDVYNETGVAFAEIVELKIFLGIGEEADPDFSNLLNSQKNNINKMGITPGHVYRLMDHASLRLSNILGGKTITLR